MAKKSIIDLETGEYFGELEEGDRIVKKKSVDYLSNTVPLQVTGRKFIKLYANVTKLLMEDLVSITEYKVFLTMVNNIQYNTFLLGKDNGNLLKISDLCKLSGVSLSSCKRVMTRFEELGIIKKGKDKIFCNPYVFCRGNRAYKSVLDMFKDTKYNIKYKGE